MTILLEFSNRMASKSDMHNQEALQLCRMKLHCINYTLICTVSCYKKHATEPLTVVHACPSVHPCPTAAMTWQL